MPQNQRLYRADSQVFNDTSPSKICLLLFEEISAFSQFSPSQIPWFCGTSKACRTLGHPGSLQIAIANIEKNFVVVGVLEQVKYPSSLQRVLNMIVA